MGQHINLHTIHCTIFMLFVVVRIVIVAGKQRRTSVHTYEGQSIKSETGVVALLLC